MRGLGIKQAATILHGAGIGGIDPEEAAAALAEGTLLGLYSFRQHMTGDNGNHGKPEELSVMVFDADNEEAVQRGVNTGRIMAEAASLARDLANQPANEMTPTRLAAHAEEDRHAARPGVPRAGTFRLRGTRHGRIPGRRKGQRGATQVHHLPVRRRPQQSRQQPVHYRQEHHL